jgi:tetratricopeptide (TPR) repeat protein/class 3 adenylate cyclase/tRNA A-37 threonylcarbamoyl transferase component Bud32
MTGRDARWLRVQELFSAALELPSADRGALLDRECAGDEALRRDVASLLACHERTGPIDRLAAELSPAIGRARSHAGPEPGSAVSHYVILDVLGAGGMGVVYRARDERLHRSSALKFLPPHRVADPAAKRRFLTEARAVAALDHPNVCTIYEIGETPEGQLYLAMPLYEGETLQARMLRGPLPVDRAIRIARDIAAGLDAAHQHGIIHRDVKPSNVMLLHDERLKILDFGVAKVKGLTLTATGAPVGTVAYMSPEQIRGDEVDHRADVWALGVVLYEMLTGRLPFTGATSAALAYAIGTRTHLLPSEFREEVPAALDDLVGLAMAKAPERRFVSMRDFAAALDAVQAGTPAARTQDETHSRGARAVLAASGPPLAERRRAAVLVTLVSGYGSLVEHLNQADLDEVIASVREAAVEVVRRNGGVVNQALGEEIVSVFGIPAGHEDDEVRAVKAALELRARVGAITTLALERRGLRLAVQTGIDSGSVVAQRLSEGARRYDISGTPSQTAARLASHAAPDAVLISSECQRLVRPFVSAEPAHPIVMQPDARPIVCYRVFGESGVHTRIEATDPSALTPFTGRGAELAMLEKIVSESQAGRGRIAVVVGDAGIGKSRIVHELRERVRTSGVRVLNGRCKSYGGVSPYLPIVEILGDALGARRGDDPAPVVARVREIDPGLEPFIPFYLHLLSVPSEEFPVPRHLQGEHLHAAMLDAVAALLTAAAQDASLLLLLEDWHWADEASREVLHRIAEVVDSHPLAVVVATRPEAGIVAELAGKSTVVQLEPLERPAAAVLLRALLGADRISEDLVSRVQERTGGNPFFLEQVALTLQEENALVTTGGETVLARDIEGLRLPVTVQAVIRARLDRLDGDAREVLRVASVIGREFGRGLLIAAVPRHLDTPRALERLRNAALIQQIRVVPEPVYRFKHVLTQDVAYDSLLEHQRKAAHLAIGRALEREHAGRGDDHAETLAHHFGEAEAWPEAVDYGRRAAERLRALSQFADSLAMFERLHSWISHLPDDSARRELLADILLERERLCETLGQRRRQQEIINELIALLAPHGASSKLAEAYLRQGDLLTLLKQFDGAERALNTALRLSRDGEDRRLERSALRSVGLLRWHQDRHHEALAIAEKTLAFDRAIGDERSIIGDLANIGNILRALGDYGRARAVLEEALTMPAAEREPSPISSVLHNLANVHRACGDLDAALDCLLRSDEAMRIHMLPVHRSFHLTTIAHIRLQQGNVEAALQTYQQAVDLSRRARHAEGLAQALRLLGDVQFGLQQDAAAAGNLSEAAALFAQLEDRTSQADLWAKVAIARERLGDWRAAHAAWITVLDLRRTIGDSLRELDAREGVARALRQVAPVEAVPAFEQALALATVLGAASRQLALHNTLGILQWERGAFAEALRHYDAGLRLCRDTADRAHEGLMLNSMGVALTRLQRYDEARTVLDESVALNRRTGERLLEAHALAALAEVSMCRGRGGAALECLDTAIAIRRELGDEPAVAEMLSRRATVTASLSTIMNPRHADEAAR